MLMGFDVQISNNRISSTISFLSFSLSTLDIYSNQGNAVVIPKVSILCMLMLLGFHNMKGAIFVSPETCYMYFEGM